MLPSRRHCLFASLALLAITAWAPQSSAETLTITSTPPGATVEINGVVTCKTPCQLKYPGGYFHKTKTVFGTKLQYGMKARIYKDGFTVREVTLTEGPLEWVSISGKDHGHYWIFKATHFEIALESASRALNGTLQVTSDDQSAPSGADFTTEQIVQRAEASVVKIRSDEGWGTGFLITDTGVIATNHHVVEGTGSDEVIFADGRRVEGTVIYTDADKDIALVKVPGANLPHLPLADKSQIRVGETVLVIGNPVGGMANSVTKGIISAVGRKPDAGEGTWIQTDAAINPGNSGGPLLNTHAQVVGINTLREFYSGNADGNRPLQGIGFALSSADLLSILQRFYHDPGAPGQAPALTADGQGSVAIGSDPVGADIYIDGNFVGQTPSTIKLPSGQHRVEVKARGKQTWTRDLNVLKDSELTLHPTLVEAVPDP